jgi:hypothetical protein
MAYNNKYKISVATQTGAISYLYILEDGYSGSVIEFPGINLQLQYIPRSDNLYEPIIVSQLSVVIDVTDNVSNMPDFTTLNDRKYLVKLYSGTDLEWQGWAISDSVSFSFSTGRKELSFNAIDGLGMLENIAYSFPIDYTLTDRKTCLSYILNSLSLIQFPTGLNFISGISFFAEGMTNRTTSTTAEPLIQSYINAASFVDDRQTPDNCLSVLTKIATGFGCKLFQASGKWYLISFTQFAQSSYYYTEYNASGTVVTSGTKSLIGQIQGFANNTSGLYFVDNSQMKIIRKGYNKISFLKQVETPNNYITNWDLKKYTSTGVINNTAFSWTQTFNPTYSNIYVKDYPQNAFNSFIMSCNESFISIKPDNLPKIGINENISISFDANGLNVPGSAGNLFLLKITLVGGGLTYYIDNNKNWVTTGTNYFYQTYTPDNPNVSFKIDLAPAPVSGTFAFEVILAGNTATYWKSTLGNLEVRNFQLVVEPSFRSLLTESYINTSKDYVLNIDLPLGYNDVTDGYFSYRGFLSNSSGLNLKNWYRIEYPTDIYRSLSELVVKQYSNCLNKNVINLDASFMGMATTNGRLSGAMRLTATDTDPSQINVSSKKYIIANSTIDLPHNVIQATLLDINNENITTTLTTTYDSNAIAPAGGRQGRYRSAGNFYRADAVTAPLTTNKLYLINGDNYSPSIGDVYYTNAECTSPFNGATLWWKVMTTDTTVGIFRINGSGIITEN